MAATAELAGVQIVAGDTKVVDRGSADRLFINTAGVGLVPSGIEIAGDRAQPGDAVLVSGTIGDHGMTIMTQREGLKFDSPLASDCAPLNELVAYMLAELPSDAIHCLRDPTRGGLATTLNELAQRSDAGIEIEEMAVPVREAVRGACELLGLDPLYVANEGKLVAIVAPDAAQALLERVRAHEFGREAAIIGRVADAHPGRVVLRTALGTRRVVDMLTGEQLPRIC
jgi:hydrogenase expression/formation protein HypE